MTEILMQKFEDSFHPVDAEGIAALKATPENSIIKIKFSVPRNARQLRLFFAMVNVVFDHQPEPRWFATRDKLREAITIRAGHFHEVKGPKGEVYTIPDSISFGSMDQMAWREFFDAAKNVILTQILPRVNSRDLDRQVADMLREPDHFDGRM